LTHVNLVAKRTRFGQKGKVATLELFLPGGPMASMNNSTRMKLEAGRKDLLDRWSLQHRGGG